MNDTRGSAWDRAPIDELEVFQVLALRVRQERVRQCLTQPAMASASRVTLRTYKRFEKTGKGSIETLVRVAYALGRGTAIDMLFPQSQLHLPTFQERLERIRVASVASARPEASARGG